MTNKTTLFLAIATAFVIGTMFTGTMAYATNHFGLPNGSGWNIVSTLIQDILDRLDTLEAAPPAGIHTTVSSYQRTSTFTIPAAFTSFPGISSGTVLCDTGDIVTGGGGSVNSGFDVFSDLIESHPYPEGNSVIATGWNATITNTATFASITGNTYVMCLNVTP